MTAAAVGSANAAVPKWPHCAPRPRLARPPPARKRRATRAVMKDEPAAPTAARAGRAALIAEAETAGAAATHRVTERPVRLHCESLRAVLVSERPLAGAEALAESRTRGAA